MTESSGKRLNVQYWRSKTWNLRLAVPVPPSELTTYDDIRTYLFVFGHAPNGVLEWAAEKFCQERSQLIESALVREAGFQIRWLASAVRWGRSTLGNWKERLLAGSGNGKQEQVVQKEPVQEP